MTGSENGGSNKQRIDNNIQKKADIYEDEINLIGYFLVLWKRKWSIFLSSVLLALLIGLILFLLPRDYKIAYTYNMGLDETTFKVLEDQFYSTENLEKLTEKLQVSGFNEYAKKVAGAGTYEALKGLVSFEVLPSYFEAIEPSKVKNLDELKKLKNSGSGSLDRLPSDIILQFNDVGGNSAYLPLPYQIQAAETKIINPEEQIRANKEKYEYYAGLLDLNEKLFSYVKKVMPSYCTLKQFHSIHWKCTKTRNYWII
jgi:hypothetical protein